MSTELKNTMHPLIQRAIDFRREFTKTNSREELKGMPFIVFKSEWDNFIKSKECKENFPGKDLSKATKFNLAEMRIHIIDDTVHS